MSWRHRSAALVRPVPRMTSRCPIPPTIKLLPPDRGEAGRGAAGTARRIVACRADVAAHQVGRAFAPARRMGLRHLSPSVGPSSASPGAVVFRFRGRWISRAWTLLAAGGARSSPLPASPLTGGRSVSGLRDRASSGARPPAGRACAIALPSAGPSSALPGAVVFRFRGRWLSRAWTLFTALVGARSTPLPASPLTGGRSV